MLSQFTSFFAVDKMKVAVVRVVSGSLMTSLEMAGVSLTLLRLTPQLLTYFGQFSVTLIIRISMNVFPL